MGPNKVRTTDGHTFKKQRNGSYKSDGLTYPNMLQIQANHTIVPYVDYKYEINQKLWYKGAPVRVTKREVQEDHGSPLYYIDNPDGTPHPASPVFYVKEAPALTSEHTPDKDLLELGDRIGCYGTISKIQAIFDWTVGTRIYLVLNAQGQTKWTTRNMIHKYNSETSASKIPLGFVFCNKPEDCEILCQSWVVNHGIVESYDGPGIRYWIEWMDQFYQCDSGSLTDCVHWKTKFKVGNLVDYADEVWRVVSYETTRRTRGGKADDEILYNIIEASKPKSYNNATTTVAQRELKEHIPEYEPGDEIKVIGPIYGDGIPEHFCDVYNNRDGIILKKSSENHYCVAVPGEDIPKSIINISHGQMELRE